MSAEIKKQIENEVKNSKESLQIITAFCKESGLEFIDKNISSGILIKRILVRFRMEDIISGVTDFSIYDYCKVNGWILYIRFDLHAKTYIFDNKRCVIGSANLTNKGLIMGKGGNFEIASLSTMEQDDIVKVNSLFENALLLDENLYCTMKSEIDRVSMESKKHYVWSNEITKLFSPSIDVLFTYDFPMLDNFKEYQGIEIDFLGLVSNWNMEELREAFQYSKIYLWLKMLLLNNNCEMYFGEVTANLHNILVNDPRPYRREVKILLARLLQWIQDLEIDEIQIDRPNHSQRIRIA